MRLIGPAAPTVSSRSNAPTRRSSWSAALRRRRSMPKAIGALVAGYYRDGKLIYAGRVGTGYTRAVATRLVEAAASARDRQAAVRRDPAGRGAPPRRALGRAEDGDRIPFPRLDRRRHGAAGRVQGRARGQAGEGGCSRAAGRGGRRPRSSPVAPRRNRRAAARRNQSALRSTARPAPARQAPAQAVRSGRRRPLHPSGSRLLGRCRRHQAGSRRLLRVGVGLDGAACRQRAAESAALPRRHRRSNASSRSTPRPGSTTSCCAASSTASAGR